MHFPAFTPFLLPRSSGHLLACALPLVWAGNAVAARLPETTAGHESRPYLAVCPPPPLRFAQPVILAEPFFLNAIAAGPPHPSAKTEENASATNAVAAPTPTGPAESITHVAPVVPPSTRGDSAPPAAPTGIAILPDDTPREIHPEDVLQYFRFPGGAPSAGLPPRSSATYEQK